MIEQRFCRIIMILLLPIVINAQRQPHFVYNSTSAPYVHNYPVPKDYNSIEERPKPPLTPPSTPCPNTPKNIALKFSNLGLKRIGDYFVSSSDVTSLNLDDNHIDHITGAAFQSLPRLMTLDLSRNKLPRKNLLRFSNCVNLRTLKINDNKIKSNNTDVPNDIIERLPNLEVLELQGHSIVKFDVSLRDFSPRLTKLDLSRNNLTSPTFLRNLPDTLTHLYLQENKIQSVEELVVKNLEELLLDGNKIQQLCSDNCGSSSLSLEAATRLKKLQISRNKISEIKENAFQHTGSLVYLDLSQNQIQHLENGTLNRLMNLEVFNISGNSLTLIPHLCGLKYLTTLDLSGNFIGGVHSNSLCSLSYLKTLKLNNNHITSIESYSFYRTERLEHLDLSNNLLITLKSLWITPANSLRVLLLKNNKISKLDKLSIEEVKLLEDLHLEGNPLSNFEVQMVFNFPRRLLVHLKEAVPSLDEEEQVEEENFSDKKDENDEEADEEDKEDDEEDKDDDNSIDKKDNSFRWL